MNLWEKLQREILGAISDQVVKDMKRATEQSLTKEDVERAEFQATTLEFGNELIFAVLGLEAEAAGTKATFEIELRGRKRKVTVE